MLHANATLFNIREFSSGIYHGYGCGGVSKRNPVGTEEWLRMSFNICVITASCFSVLHQSSQVCLPQLSVEGKFALLWSPVKKNFIDPAGCVTAQDLLSLRSTLLWVTIGPWDLIDKCDLKCCLPPQPGVILQAHFLLLLESCHLHAVLSVNYTIAEMCHLPIWGFPRKSS